MELLESLLVNKKNFRILTTIYIIVVIIVLVWIWWPESSSDIAKYEPYDEITKNRKMVEYYVRFVESIKEYNDVETLEYYFNNSYLEYHNTTLENIMYTLKSTSASYVLGAYDVYENGEQYIYSIALPSQNNSLRVNFVEQRYPYNFSITYGTFVDYSERTYYSIFEKAEFKIEGTYKDLNYIEYELAVKNNNYDELSLDFSSVDNFKLNLNDGSKVSLNLVQSTQDKLTLARGQTSTVKLVFNVGINKQSSINLLSINNVFNGISKINTTISF